MTLRAYLPILMTSILTVACGGPVPEQNWLDGRLVDLSHLFDETTLYWPTSERFLFTVDSRGMSEAGYYYEANSFCAAEHGGTHLDAPSHFAEGGWRTDEIPLDRLIGKAVVVDVREQAASNPDYLISTGDLLGWEEEHGPLPAGCILLLSTGYGQRWPDAEAYLGTASRGPEAVAQLHFPGLDPQAARWLVRERSVASIGIDTASIDHGQSKNFETHQVLFEANIPVFENVASMDQLPTKGFHVIALPMKIGGGSGGPLRIVAVVPSR